MGNDKEDTEDISAQRMIHRNEAMKAIAFANTNAKTEYDSNHTALRLKEGDMIFVKLHGGYSVPDEKSKLAARRAGPFQIKRRVGRLAYELELPKTWKIHPVLSVAHLETGPKDKNPCERTGPKPQPLEVNDDDSEWQSYEVERLVDKRYRKYEKKVIPEYLVHWKGYGAADRE